MSDDKGDSKVPQRWLPIECNPDTMNKFLYQCGMPKSWGVSDVFGLDEPLLAMLPKPVLGIMLLYPIGKDLVPEGVVEEENKDGVYFMKQTISNACGTVAMIHCIANNLESIKVEGGFLKDFLDQSMGKSADEKANILEYDKDVCNSHDEVARAGQSAVPNLNDNVDYHFVALIEKNGTLYELDGRKSGPINRGPTTKESFVVDAAQICKKYMELDPGNIRFSVLALTPSE
uniref:Ubiquitin carboxyl-terminal hydrolase n=1 Tax=Caligus rogercresseyi TaxID=217165 RepID=C1BQK2_CALRO|nr:Ubiquitin carboxyl-terminal hydrolase isozyme L3 [Caligus rogercresseyi]|eukprot:TRINITY_DN1554_c0_g1_i3.p1 TRINITY_DN1554_c0_g1~~TRINITY_DN1554_c0_g1_i3.p1  ORF type:complete len:231 (+),score=80.56 TRINITY_DN1554_c0_g1_i3:166-858(+)